MKSCYELFGIECGQGWQALYEPLIDLCKQEGVAITQIKEKCGTLRFYVGAAPDHVRDAIDAAEQKSATTCEQCGRLGKRRDAGWIRTLCAKCAKKDAAKQIPIATSIEAVGAFASPIPQAPDLPKPVNT